MVKCILFEKSGKKFEELYDTVARRIKNWSEFIKTELPHRVKNCDFALQMNESTDVAELAVLIVSVCTISVRAFYTIGCINL